MNAARRRRIRHRMAWLVATATTLLTLCGCGPMVVAGATYGAAVAYDRRSADVVLDDEIIELRARDAYLKHPQLSEHSQLKATSYNLSVLITGQAESAQIADRFARLVAQLPKVKQVYNEAEIGPMISLGQLGKDAMLTSRAKLAIQSIKLPGFDALRVKVVTDNGVVYLMGLVTPAEGDATAEKVRRIPGVQRVVKIFEYIEPKRPNRAAAPA
ncbi:BON domain-containing protein [uncultured Thiohalocapsa sp.]|uniref:BON domain-containing protein n=1 Tax=uncultured Thiohalocapsa sp. TaxID=768990 RepID=UPI0025E85F8C|nr:BON domain-containing protein [uncultured Thiohalocapsa sp.]